MTVRVLVVKPGCEPQVEMIENSENGVRSIIGGKGTIEERFLAFVTKNADAPDFLNLVCIKDGESLGLPPNRLMGTERGTHIKIFGTFLLCRIQENERFASLTDEQIRFCSRQFSLFNWMDPNYI